MQQNLDVSFHIALQIPHVGELRYHSAVQKLARSLENCEAKFHFCTIQDLKDMGPPLLVICNEYRPTTIEEGYFGPDSRLDRVIRYDIVLAKISNGTMIK